MHGLAEVPLFAALARSERVLVAGCGGGYDVYGGLPLFLALRAAGKQAFLASLTFAEPYVEGARALAPALVHIDHSVTPDVVYFPEFHLACWLEENGLPSSVYCFERTGVVPLRAAYRTLIAHHRIDAIVVVDGGTDSLMRGDEAGLGTPHEDVLTLVALDGLALDRYLVCLGFGVDAFHGVCHAHFLENSAALAASGAFLGTFSLLPQQPEARAYLAAVAHACAADPEHPSIVNTSVASAVEGHFGDHQRTARTRGSSLFINPLMAMYFCYELQAVVDRLLYKSTLEPTLTFSDVVVRVEAARRTYEGRRARVPLPM